MTFLEKLFGTNGEGQPEALTYEQLKAKIEADKKLKLVNLEDGGYVSIDKFNAAETEAKGYKKQLEDAQKEIKSYKDMDIDGIKQAAADYEEKSKKEIADLQKQLSDQKLEFAEDKFLSQYKFADEFAKAGVKAEFRAKGFKYDDNTGTFLGADEYMKGIMESHKGAFLVDDGGKGGDDNGGSGGDGKGGDAGQKQKPSFLGKPGNGGTGGEENAFGFSFMGVRPRPETK